MGALVRNSSQEMGHYQRETTVPLASSSYVAIFPHPSRCPFPLLIFLIFLIIFFLFHLFRIKDGAVQSLEESSIVPFLYKTLCSYFFLTSALLPSGPPPC